MHEKHMTKDYVHSTLRSNRKRKHPAWLLGSISVATILFISVYFYHSTHAKSVKSTTPKPNSMAAHSTPKATQQDHNSDPQPAFTLDFYSMLSQPYPAPTTSPVLLSTKNAYFLQVAATSSESGALQLASKLGTKGYNATIKKSRNQYLTIYRVLTGPYRSRQSAQDDAKQLTALNTKPIIVHQKNFHLNT